MHGQDVPQAPRFAVALAIAAVAWNLAGCGGSCLEFGIIPGAVLHIDSRAAVGMYRVEVDVGGETLIVTYATTADGQASCVACKDIQGGFTLAAAGSNEPVTRFLASDVDLNVVRTGTITGPAELQLRIYRDDVLVIDEAVRPTYRTSEPWGDGCGESTTAQIDVVVP